MRRLRLWLCVALVWALAWVPRCWRVRLRWCGWWLVWCSGRCLPRWLRACVRVLCYLRLRRGVCVRIPCCSPLLRRSVRLLWRVPPRRRLLCVRAWALRRLPRFWRPLALVVTVRCSREYVCCSLAAWCPSALLCLVRVLSCLVLRVLRWALLRLRARR